MIAILKFISIILHTSVGLPIHALHFPYVVLRYDVCSELVNTV
jgi:hypothetical protein